MIVARDIVRLAHVASPADKRIGLTGRAADQYRIVGMLFPDPVQQRIDQFVAAGRSQLEMEGFIPGSFPLLGKSLDQFTLADAIGKIRIIIFGKIAIELTHEAAQTQCLEGRCFLLHRESNFEQSSSVLVTHRRKAFGEAARACEEINNLEHHAPLPDFGIAADDTRLGMSITGKRAWISSIRQDGQE